ncbi:STAS/SEC14 domain-containing protein [Sphingomonas sp. MMS12-HWE2-04]|uniref:STAS/SEC14 domain-containing protein n=1 Tax=Sphingomonas sp. MMS12-HWE2-04 TaxID=3234199 RepID=UPI00385022E0
MYTMRFDHELNLLDIRWIGLFAPEAVGAYAEDLARRFAAEGFKSGYLLRMDMSASAVQTQDAVAAFRRSFDHFPAASRIAIVTPSALAKLQVRREMTQSYMRIFDTRCAAMAWLTDTADRAAA